MRNFANFEAMDLQGTLEKLSSPLTPVEREGLATELSAYLNALLVNDFPALVQVLYRVDVSEEKLKAVLRQNPGADAGDLLAELLIERQQQKAIARQAPPSAADASEEEAW